MEAPTEEWAITGILRPGGPTTTMVVPGFASKELANAAKKIMEDRFNSQMATIFVVVQTK